MVKKKTKKAKKPSIASLKKKLWTIFSLYIRTKYSINGYVKCVTCGEARPIKEMQAGHFIQGRHHSVLFNELNVHPQCVTCNIFKHGNLIPYYEFMVNTYGQCVIDELKEMDKKTKKFTVDELQEMIIEYKDKLQKLV